MVFFRNVMRRRNTEFRKEMEETSAKVMEMVELYNTMTPARFPSPMCAVCFTRGIIKMENGTNICIFVNFKNVQRTSRKKVPFGIGQIGKSFRNEITPGNFTFRTREFEQMELEFFCKPGTDLEWFQYWRGFCRDWLLALGLKEDEIRLRDHSPEELCFYSKGRQVN